MALGRALSAAARARRLPRRCILLDFDSTDDPTHGKQEGTAYHGYYRQHMYHPLLVFDGDTDQFITAFLRPGNAHASKGVVAVLRRIVRSVRETWPEVRSPSAPMRGSPSPRCTTTARRRGSN